MIFDRHLIEYLEDTSIDGFIYLRPNLEPKNDDRNVLVVKSDLSAYNA